MIDVIGGYARVVICHSGPVFDEGLGQEISWPGELDQKVEAQLAFVSQATCRRNRNRRTSAKVTGEFDLIVTIGTGATEVWSYEGY